MLNEFYDKPWMRPMQYTDSHNAGAPDREAAEATEDEVPADLRMDSERVEKMAGKPAGSLRDTTPLDYRTGNPEHVFGLDDDDEA
jgi:hypothetical protein